MFHTYKAKYLSSVQNHYFDIWLSELKKKNMRKISQLCRVPKIEVPKSNKVPGVGKFT